MCTSLRTGFSRVEETSDDTGHSADKCGNGEGECSSGSIGFKGEVDAEIGPSVTDGTGGDFTFTDSGGATEEGEETEGRGELGGLPREEDGAEGTRDHNCVIVIVLDFDFEDWSEGIFGTLEAGELTRGDEGEAREISPHELLFGDALANPSTGMPSVCTEDTMGACSTIGGG